MVAVGPDANPLDDPQDADALAQSASRLVDAVAVALTPWAERVVAERWSAWQGSTPPGDLREAARRAGELAQRAVVPALRELLSTDVDGQWTSPLAIVRRATAPVTEVLQAAGVPEVERDPQAERLFPDDRYDLVPAAFADLDPAVHDAGLVWGAAKAYVILARRRRGER